MNANERAPILIVDDDPVTSRLIGGVLDMRGLGPVVAMSRLAEAGRAITQTAFRAIIADLHLPDGNGMELVHLVRRTPRSLNRDVTIVVCSAYANQRVTALLARLGADAVLGKPADPDTLVALLDAGRKAA